MQKIIPKTAIVNVSFLALHKYYNYYVATCIHANMEQYVVDMQCLALRKKIPYCRKLTMHINNAKKIVTLN